MKWRNRIVYTALYLVAASIAMIFAYDLVTAMFTSSVAISVSMFGVWLGGTLSYIGTVFDKGVELDVVLILFGILLVLMLIVVVAVRV